MKVLNSAKWVSRVAASGGLMLVLSGGAWAAEGDTVVTAESDQNAPVSASQSQTSSTSTVSLVTIAEESQSIQESGAPIGAALEPASANVVGGATPAATVELTQVPTAAEGAAVSIIVQPESAAVPAESKANEAVVMSTPAAAAYRVYDLPVQPVVTGFNSMPVSDLASQLPTAAPASPDKVPAPAQPTGVLGQLSAQLAGSVVKPVFVPVAAALGASSTLNLIIFLTLLIACAVAPAFGFATRRDGYAHAARSDVAAATFNLLFATPSSMSYVMATRQSATHF